METEYIRLLFNAKTGTMRKEKMNGRNYTAVPAAMIAEGVWAGSKGPVFYSKKELDKSAPVWNNKPAVLHHPEFNGKGVTACDPKILESQQMGLLFNTNSGEKLRTEVWFDDELAKKVSPDVMNAVEKGENVEVSTGLLADLEVSPGVFNGKKYTHVAKNIRPDHLAILPGKIGAYSVDDGGGLLANQSNETDLFSIETQDDLDTAVLMIGNNSGGAFDKMRERLKTIASTKGLKLEEVVVNKVEVKEVVLSKEEYILMQKMFLDRVSDEKVQVTVTNADGTTTLVNNTVSHRDLAKGIGEAMYNENKRDGYWPGYVEDIYPNFFVYSERGKYYKRDYSLDMKHNVAIGNQAEQIKKYQEWQNTKGGHIAITNKDMSGSYVIKNSAAPVVVRVEERKVELVTPVTNKDKNMSKVPVQTTEEYIANAPPGPIQESLQDMLEAHKQAKSDIIANIVKLPKCAYTEVELHAKSLPELQKMQATFVPDAPVRRAIYVGQGGMPPINNTTGDNLPKGPKEALGGGVLNFRQEKVAAK